MVTLRTSQEEAQFIVTLLGELPTKSNAHQLFLNLNNQLQEQTSKKDESKLSVVKDDDNETAE